MSSKIIRISNRVIVDNDFGGNQIVNDISYVEFDDETVGATFTEPGYNGEILVYVTTNIYNIEEQFETKRPIWYRITHLTDGSIVGTENIGTLYAQLEHAIRQWYAEATEIEVVN